MTDQFEMNLAAMEAKSEIIRGRIIHETITIENYISIVLTHFFPKKETEELFDKYIMGDTLSFDQKKQILCSLIKNNEITLPNLYKEFAQDLQVIQDLRNIIAHTTLKSTKEEIESYDGSNLKYISFSRKFWKKEITMLLGDSNQQENLKKDIYSFSNFRDRINNITGVIYL